MTDRQSPPSGSTPIQHGQSTLQVQTSSRDPFRSYAAVAVADIPSSFSQHFCDAYCGLARPVGLDRAVVDRAADLLRDRLGDRVRRRIVEAHAAAGAVALQPVADMEALLEVML